MLRVREGLRPLLAPLGLRCGLRPQPGRPSAVPPAQKPFEAPKGFEGFSGRFWEAKFCAHPALRVTENIEMA